MQSADAALDARNVALLIEASDDLRDYAAKIGHRRSGLMDDSMVRFGPFSIGAGALEARIASGADYAEQEVARGGQHDWAMRTISESDARILQLQLEVEHALVSVLTGAG